MDSDAGMPIGRHMAHGTLWMVGMRWMIRLIGLGNTAIIARILIPEDFGIVALSMIAVDFLMTMTDGDIEMALVRTQTPNQSLFDTGWTLKILAALLSCGVLWAIASPVATHFGDNRIATVIRIAALRPLFLGFENIGVAEFRRTLRFSAEFRYLVLQRVLSFFSSLALVFSFRNYLALAWSMPVSAILTVMLSYWVTGTRARLSLAHWRELWRFSRWQMLFNSGRLLGERCDQFIISWLAGIGETGVYVVGFDLAMMPTREIMLPSGRALMPAYAKIAHDDVQLKAAFRVVLGFAAVVASSVGIGMSCVAEDAVYVVLGDQWGAAVPYVRWLGVFGALEGAWLMLDPFLIAARKERTLALSNLIFSAVTIPVIAIAAVMFGVVSIPAARIAVMSVMLSGVFWRMVRWRWVSLADLIGVLWRPLTAAATMAFGVSFFRLTGASSSHFLMLLHDIAVGSVFYLFSLFVLWYASGRPDGAEGDFAAIAFGWLAKRTRRRIL